MKTRLFRLLPLLLIALIGAVLWLHGARQDGGVSRTLACEDLREGCRIALDGEAVTVRMLGELKPLRAFEVRVLAPHARKVTARFTMRGMDMGFNLYTLRADNDGMFQSSVTLPVCVTGRRDWIMEVEVDGVRLAVPFVTDI